MPTITHTTVPKGNVIALRHYGSYATVSETWGKLAQIVLSSGAASSSLRPVGISYDDPNLVSADNLRYDATFAVDAQTHTTLRSATIGLRGLRLEELPEFKAATIVHKGSYRKLRETYADLTMHLGLRGHQTPFVFVEEYVNSPFTTPEEDLETKINARIG